MPRLIERRVGLFVFSVLSFLLGSVIYYRATWSEIEEGISGTLEERLRVAADMAPQMLLPDWHDRPLDEGAVSREEEREARERLTGMARSFGIAAAWTLVKDGDAFRVAASSSADGGERGHAIALPEAFAAVHATGEPAWGERSDARGSYWSWCERRTGPGGHYLVLVDFDAAERSRLLTRAWTVPLLSILWLIFISSPGALLLFLLQGDISEANRGLAEANELLKEKVASQRREIERGRHDLEFMNELQRRSIMGVAIFDGDGRILDINPSAMEILGIEGEPASGELTIPSIVGLDRWEGVMSRMRAADDPDELFAFDERHVLPNGEERIIAVRIGHAVGRGDREMYYAYITDITELETGREQMRWAAYHDEATGLLNQIGFKETIKEGLDDHDGASPAVFVLAIDLKRVNAAFGIRVGDAALEDVARRLSEGVRQGEILARMGGVEFGLSKHGIRTDDEGQAVAARLLRVLDEPFVVGERKFSLYGSVGMRIPTPNEALDDVISKAFIAAKEAKQRGRSSVLSFDGMVRTDNIRNIEIEDWLREELDRGRDFQIFFQPIVDIATETAGKIRDVEALVRWKSPDGDWISPDIFIPIAERSGLIEPLSEVLFATSAKNFLALREVLPDVALSLNVSAELFSDALVAPMLERHLEAHGVAPRDVLLEITETALIDDMDRAHDIIVPLVDRGYSLAIDDFGTGHTSISYLQKFPIHTVKIDKSFIHHIDQNENDWSVVQALLRMSEVLGVTVIAEGVENREQERLLREWGCPLGQGYLYHRPANMKTCLEVFSERRWLGRDGQTA